MYGSCYPTERHFPGTIYVSYPENTERSTQHSSKLGRPIHRFLALSVNLPDLRLLSSAQEPTLFPFHCCFSLLQCGVVVVGLPSTLHNAKKAAYYRATLFVPHPMPSCG